MSSQRTDLFSIEHGISSRGRFRSSECSCSRPDLEPEISEGVRQIHQALGFTLFLIGQGPCCFGSHKHLRICRKGAGRQREQRMNSISATSAPLPLCGKPNVITLTMPEMSFGNHCAECLQGDHGLRRRRAEDSPPYPRWACECPALVGRLVLQAPSSGPRLALQKAGPKIVIAQFPPQSASTTLAALKPHRPVTLPPGWVEPPQR